MSTDISKNLDSKMCNHDCITHEILTLHFVMLKIQFDLSLSNLFHFHGELNEEFRKRVLLMQKGTIFCSWLSLRLQGTYYRNISNFEKWALMIGRVLIIET